MTYMPRRSEGMALTRVEIDFLSGHDELADLPLRARREAHLDRHLNTLTRRRRLELDGVASLENRFAGFGGGTRIAR
jgi:hypothetical protein